MFTVKTINTPGMQHNGTGILSLRQLTVTSAASTGLSSIFDGLELDGFVVLNVSQSGILIDLSLQILTVENQLGSKLNISFKRHCSKTMAYW